jgi:DNA primase
LDRSQVTPKYVIRATYKVKGVVEKSDVVGAIFGQTEGLFGPDLDLRELQKSGRIGRIKIELQTKRDKTSGEIIIPTSLSRPSTTLIAAAIESVDRVGPCEAKVELKKLEDARETKREAIIGRAQKLLQQWTIEEAPDTQEVLKEVSESVKPAEIEKYGPEKLSAGPEVASSKQVIVVEGRADVGVLLRAGVKNVIACEGTSIPETIIKLSKDKEVTAFLDGDRGGDIIFKEMLQVADVDYVARAPKGREVEELTPKEALNALRKKTSVREHKRKMPAPRRVLAVPKPIRDKMTSLKGTLEAMVFDEKGKEILRTPVGKMYDELKKLKKSHTIIFDGVITQRLIDIAGEKDVSLIIGDRISNVVKRPVGIKLLTIADIAN